MIGQEWFRSPGFIHSVVLLGLQPATAYFYQCGNDEDGWSQVFPFTSPFVVGCGWKCDDWFGRIAASTRSVNFIAYADMGIWDPPTAQTTAELVNEDVWHMCWVQT